jgi:hypothetical protein
MIRSLIYTMMCLLAILLVLYVAERAHAAGRASTPGDVFYNFYVPPMGDESVGAELYPCPRPTPAYVGYTYITYQPLMPHEFLYHHHRTYVTYHPDAPRTRTTVTWR